jgi:Uma2 family endonuclease
MGKPVEKEEHYSFEAYLALEQSEGIRFEYHQGQVFAMAGGSDVHNELTGNLRGLIKEGIKGRPCKVYAENVKLELLEATHYVYPDIMLTCDPSDHQDRFIKRHPILLAEVLSVSTAAEDGFGKKFQAYMKLPSLQYYLLVTQEHICIECYSREENRSGWHYECYEATDDVIPLPKLNMPLTVAEVYEKVGGMN